MKVLELLGRSRQTFFSTFNSLFQRVKEDGEQHHSQREPLGQHMCEGWCPSQLRWLSWPGALSCSAAHPPLHLPWISSSTELLQRSVEHTCAIPACCGGDHFCQYWVIAINLFGKSPVEGPVKWKYGVRHKECDLRTSLSTEESRGGKDGGHF